jgi:GNAT superfamily N-acetyltransferase
LSDVVTVRTAVTDADYEQWRQVRLAVLPNERAPSAAEMREMDAPGRLLLLAELDGKVAGSGLCDRSDLAGRAALVPRVLPALRRRGVGRALLRVLAEFAAARGHTRAGSGVDDDDSMAFAERFGFREVDRQVEQLRTVGDEPWPQLPAGITIVTVAQRPELWDVAYTQVAVEAFQDMAVLAPMQVSLVDWGTTWINAPEMTFLALAGDEVVGLASLYRDDDRPGRSEQGFTAVRRAYRGRGIASTLKRMTLAYAAEHDIREIYTWTQTGNEDMRRLNEHLGFRYGAISRRVEAALPLTFE